MRSVGSLEGSAAGVFVELTNAEVTRRVLKLQLHGEPASEEKLYIVRYLWHTPWPPSPSTTAPERTASTTRCETTGVSRSGSGEQTGRS